MTLWLAYEEDLESYFSGDSCGREPLAHVLRSQMTIETTDPISSA